MNILQELRRRFAQAAPEGADVSAFAAAVRESTSSKFGDYQANGCMAIAKARGGRPQDVAREVLTKLDLSPMADPPELAGAGFLNVRLHESWLAERVLERLDDDRLGLRPPERPMTVVIDYSSPNVAKPMHVGHIRSTVIGEALARIHQALGHKIIRDNHLGDWGLQFGMIIWGWRNYRDESAYQTDPVGELARLYRVAAGKIKAYESDGDKFAKVEALEAQGKAAEAQTLLLKLFPGEERSREEIARQIAEGRAVNESARQETVKLHAGDPENRALWRQFMPYCLEALADVYERLDVKFDTQLGESYYDPMLADVVKDLQDRGLAVESQGAIVVPMEEGKPPFLVRKRDGAYNYGTTDLATIKYRKETYDPDLMLYVVDHRQSDHFKPLFETAKRWGYGDVRMEHIAFGTILGSDRKPFKTRDGDTVGLESLLNEAVHRARKVVDANSPQLSDEERRDVAEIVGLGAIKYADLSQNRTSDYVFDWDRMLAMNGNTGAYLQYSYARIQSIYRKGDISASQIRSQTKTLILDNPHERALAAQALKLPEILELAAAELKPNIVTDFLFELANRFSRFFEECPVLKAESDERKWSRLAICEVTARTLRFGLGLLGIKTADQM